MLPAISTGAEQLRSAAGTGIGSHIGSSTWFVGSSGAPSREIALALTLSPKTVARHLEAAMRKLEVSSRTALAVKAVEAGLVEPGWEAIPR